MYEGLAKDYGEIVLDSIIESAPLLEEISENIPILKTILVVIKTPKAIQDIIFQCKMNEFLYNANLSQDAVSSFKNKFSKKKRGDIVEYILISINAHDNKEKSGIIGRLFNALLKDSISLEDFHNMVHVTNNISINDIGDLRRIYTLNMDQHKVRITDRVEYSFKNLGLISSGRVVYHGGFGTASSTGGSGGYSLNQFGWIYTGIVFKNPDSAIEGYQIGCGDLVDAFNDKGDFLNSYPVSYARKEEYVYNSIDIFKIDRSANVMSDEATGLPAIYREGYILSGETEVEAISRILEGDLMYTKTVYSYKDDIHFTKKVVVLALDYEEVSDDTFLSTDISRDSIIRNGDDGHSLKVLEQINKIKKREIEMDGF